ncbi:MAG: tyrosine-type recombinase/integrase [Colwellia sp.]
MHKLRETCDKYLTYCSKNKNLANYTLKAYTLDLNQLVEYFSEDKIIEEIDKYLLREFHQFLTDKEYAPATIKRKLCCVQSMFRWLEIDDVIDINPFHKLSIRIKAPKKLPRNIPFNEISDLINTAKNELGLNKKGTYCSENITDVITSKKSLNRLTALISIELMLCTGIRVGELVKIAIGDIEIYQRKIKVMGKGSRERFVFIPDDDLSLLIKSYIQLRIITEPLTDNLLVNSRGQTASTQFIRKLIKDVSTKSQVEQKITPHMFRHSAACELLEADVDIRFVQRLLGHHSISTTELYTHVQDNTLKEKISRANVRSRFM